MRLSRSISTMVLVAASVSAHLLAAAPSQAQTNVQSAGMVYRSGTEFRLGGSQFKHIGANMGGLMWAPARVIGQELDYARDSGISVVRAFLPNSYCTTQQVIDRLRYVADQAASRGLRLTVALAHNYNQEVWGIGSDRYCGKTPGSVPPRHVIPGDEGFYTSNRSDAPGPMLSDSWMDWGYQLNYKPFATAVVSALRDHPGIFSWDIANEVNVENRRDLKHATINFYRSMATAINSADPNHMITTGLISTHWAGLDTTEDKAAVYNHPDIDYVTVHYYDRFDTHQDDDIARANDPNFYGKPVVVEEFGVGLAPSGGSMATVRQKVSDFHQAHLTGGRFDVDAINQWGVSGNLAEDTGNAGLGDNTPRGQEILSGDSTVMEWYAALWSRWADAVGNRATPPPAAPSGPTLYLSGADNKTTSEEVSYGAAGDIPLMGDWNGDGVDTPGIRRGNTWYLRNSNSSGVAEVVFSYGLPSDIAVVGDWDGDGDDTIGIVRRESGGLTWHLRNSNSGGVGDLSYRYGVDTDTPVPGDWNGDRRTTPGVFRSGEWILSNTHGGTDRVRFTYGFASDVPVSGDWNNDGIDTASVTRTDGGAKRWVLTNSHGGADRVTFTYGVSTDRPLAGDWDGRGGDTAGVARGY